MKQLGIFLVIFFLFLGGMVVAEEGCPLIGSTYSLEVEDIRYELSRFECTFGPGCRAECDLWHGNFDTGPLYHERLPFVCEPTGDVVITVDQIKIPCALNSQGDLECLIADISGYACVRLGTKIWCFPERPGEFRFDLEE